MAPRTPMNGSAAILLASCTALLLPSRASRQQFVHFESPHVHPLERTQDGTRLLAVNTVDARLEIFALSNAAPYLTLIGSVPVGLDPVSVRARSATEAWIVNHVSDSVSIVDAADLAVLLNAWGSTSELADIDCNHIVDAADISLLLNRWGPCN